MKIGIDLNICSKINCEYWILSIGHVSSYCKASVVFPEEICMVKCLDRVEGCPIPKKCKYKTLHIISGQRLNYCGVGRK